jgi:hypothetical protein
MTTRWAGRHEALVSPDGVAPYGGDPWWKRNKKVAIKHSFEGVRERILPRN